MTLEELRKQKQKRDAAREAMAADIESLRAKEQKLHVIEAVFRFTADQEKEHAEIFYNHMKELAGEQVQIDGSYPVDIYDSVLEVLKAAKNNEFEEYETVYQTFGDKAMEEGFPKVASSFHHIAKIEQVHGERFAELAELLEQNKLFISDVECKWMCLNCGHIHEGKEAPGKCPICHHDRGYFIRFELAPFTK